MACRLLDTGSTMQHSRTTRTTRHGLRWPSHLSKEIPTDYSYLTNSGRICMFGQFHF